MARRLCFDWAVKRSDLVGDHFDIATAEPDVLKLAVAQLCQRIAGHAGVVPCDELCKCALEKTTDTAVSVSSELNAGCVDCSHILILL